MLEPSRSGRPVHRDEDWFIRRDGTMFPVSFTSVPIDLPSGRGVVVTFIDMTAQREAEQALRERDAILARVEQPVWVVDHRGCIHYANPAALAALGYEQLSELEGRPGHETVHYKYPDGRPPDSHRLAHLAEVSIHDLLAEPIIAAPGHGIWRDYWRACDYRDGVPPPVVGEAATFESELQAVATGRGISITAEAAARFYARPGLRFPRIADIAPCEVAVALPLSPTPAARTFADVAVAAVTDPVA